MCAEIARMLKVRKSLQHHRILGKNEFNFHERPQFINIARMCRAATQRNAIPVKYERTFRQTVLDVAINQLPMRKQATLPYNVKTQYVHLQINCKVLPLPLQKSCRNE